MCAFCVVWAAKKSCGGGVGEEGALPTWGAGSCGAWLGHGSGSGGRLHLAHETLEEGRPLHLAHEVLEEGGRLHLAHEILEDGKEQGRCLYLGQKEEEGSGSGQSVEVEGRRCCLEAGCCRGAGGQSTERLRGLTSGGKGTKHWKVED
eukprot:1139464-Pelagomonas_calceolata.AAC.2